MNERDAAWDRVVEYWMTQTRIERERVAELEAEAQILRTVAPTPPPPAARRAYDVVTKIDQT